MRPDIVREAMEIAPKQTRIEDLQARRSVLMREVDEIDADIARLQGEISALVTTVRGAARRA